MGLLLVLEIQWAEEVARVGDAAVV